MLECNSFYEVDCGKNLQPQPNIIIEAHNHEKDFGPFHPFQRLRDQLQCDFLLAPPEALPPLVFVDPSEYNIVVHLRTGDLQWLPRDHDFLRNIKLQMETLLKGYHYHYYFIAENPSATEDNPYPPGSAYLADIFNDTTTPVTFLNNLDGKSSLFHMVNADMLVMTGSGFGYVAASLSWKPVVIHGPHKNGDYDVFKDDDWAFADGKGIIYHPPTKWELRSKIVSKHARYKGRTAPFRR